MVAVGLSPRNAAKHTIRRRGATAERSHQTVAFNRRSATRKHNTPHLIGLSLAVLVLFATGVVAAAIPEEAKFSQSAGAVGTFDFVEVTLKLERPGALNPFTDAELGGEFSMEGGGPLRVDGFCDSDDGSLYRIRFMPLKPGRYVYTATFRSGDLVFSKQGRFRARDARQPGVVRVDGQHPFHFVYEGTGAHYFWNSTTTYQILGWDDDTLLKSIERLARLGVNRVRVALCGRTEGGQRWSEPLVVRTKKFDFKMEPWPAARPDDLKNPGYDVTRFNLAHWRKADRLLRRARDLGVQVSLIFYVDGRDAGVDPFGHEGMGGPDEQRYYRYVVARCGAFANVMWDVANEYRHFRNDAWAEQMGSFIKECDPYDHLTSVHGHGDFRFRASKWADFAMYQSWDEHGGYAFMLKNREEQAKTGRPMPQVNEEYGYEDHYPTGWGENRRPPARSADSRRRLAWEITMAGCHQTTGERADRGTGAGADTGGGWINGRGDDTMVMLHGYRHLMDFFKSFAWWTCEPRPDLAGKNAHCLAAAGKIYVVYLPKGGSTELKLEPGVYNTRWFNPRNGAFTKLSDAAGPAWSSPVAPDASDWALLLERKD